MDLDSAAGVAKSKQSEIDATLGATLRDARKQIVEMERDLARAVETQNIEAFERAAAKAAAEVERIGSAIKDMADPRLRALATKAIGVDGVPDIRQPGALKPRHGKAFPDRAPMQPPADGMAGRVVQPGDAPPEKAGAVDIPGGQAQRDLERRKQELAQIDELGAMQRAKTDRREKARVREVEKQREKTENELKRATERAAQGRKLTTREKDLLEEFDAVAGKKGGAIQAQKEAAENARLRKEAQEQANAVKAGLDTSETAKKLTELLQASRR